MIPSRILNSSPSGKMGIWKKEIQQLTISNSSNLNSLNIVLTFSNFFAAFLSVTQHVLLVFGALNSTNKKKQNLTDLYLISKTISNPNIKAVPCKITLGI